MKVNWYAAATEFNSEVKLSLVSNRKGREDKLEHKGGPSAVCSFPSCSEIKCLKAAFKF